MNKLKPIISQLNRELDLQQPAKARIILEISLDMQDYMNLCLEKGMSEKEALEVTKERFLPNQQTMDQIVSLHLNLYKKWFGRLSQQVQQRWEKIMLIILIFIIGTSTLLTTFSNAFFENPSPFIWPVILLAMFSLIIALAKLYSLYIKQNHSLRQLHNWHESLLFYTSLTLLVGVFGYFYDLYASNTMAIFFNTHLSVLIVDSQDYQELLKMFTQWDIKSASLLLVSIAAFSINLFLWFIINSKLTKVEQQELSILLD